MTTSSLPRLSRHAAVRRSRPPRGCGDTCPVVADRRDLHWPVAHPDSALSTATRDETDAHMTVLLDTLPGT
ncbi:hypothetical protein [Streptomyces sp. SYP-A7185]|uniref:hypothetical protein n=1 Tax=Streptomyces sp. SYP-A7185 TaxID=3040076 RepID=UPI0038F6F8E8